ncbi:unnamed protein product [Urochloa decumbens]|uniref:F-box domain-containing protein n=1 Tax=Urochloa decumbens TaxID=240449 RepID=A0ABC9B4X2_9POAL
MDKGTWTSPPLELLLELFRRLDVTDVVRCAGTCKPWRRAIIGNAVSCLRPRPDCFIPNFLLGFFFHKKLYGDAGVSLLRTSGPFVPAFAMPTAAGAGGEDLALYDMPLSCRDGLLLIKGREVDDLWLYNTMTGDRKFIPAAAFKPDSYVLVTGYDLPTSGDLGVRILAVKTEHKDGIPVKHSPEFMKNLATSIFPGNEVVCGGAVHWLGLWTLDPCNWFSFPEDLTVDEIQGYTLAVDMRTGRTWVTKLPDQCRHGYSSCSLVLATSGDGRLSVVQEGRFHGYHGSCIQVWVLISEQWSLQRTVPVPAANMGMDLWTNNIVFCPRSGCVLVEVKGGDLIIELDTGPSRLIRYLKPSIPWSLSNSGYRYPYETDWSTYLSRMKSF